MSSDNQTEPGRSGRGSPKRSGRRPQVIGPRLRVLLWVVFALVALLAANSLYLLGVKWVGAATGSNAENFFYLCMFAVHLALGLLLVVPFVLFGLLHLRGARHRKNRRAVKVGYALFAVSLLLLVSGILLVRFEGVLDLKDATVRAILYWLLSLIHI